MRRFSFSTIVLLDVRGDYVIGLAGAGGGGQSPLLSFEQFHRGTAEAEPLALTFSAKQGT